MTSVAQLSGSSRALLFVALPIATLGCAKGHSDPGTSDGALPDSTHPVDAAPHDVSQITADAAPDGLPPDAGCSISTNTVPTLDGTNDIAKYAAAQRLSPGAMVGTDAAAVTWDKNDLYITVSSIAFGSAYEPLHIYVETGAALATTTATSGKEYSGLTPALPFSPTHLIGVRRVSDAGSGGYDGVFVPTDQWQTRTLALETVTFAASDQLSVRVPWSALGGCPTQMRLALHVVHGVAANEWKDLVPSTHTPWQVPGGGYYQIDLTASSAVAGWTLH
jgi:hypothetical protein